MDLGKLYDLHGGQLDMQSTKQTKHNLLKINYCLGIVEQ